MSTLEALAQYLQDEGLGVRGTSIFLGSQASIPAGAGPYIILIETPGEPPRATHNKGFIAYRRPHVQVVIAAKDVTIARAKSETVFQSLSFVNRRIGDVDFLKVRPLQDPNDFGADGVGRSQQKWNLACERAA